MKYRATAVDIRSRKCQPLVKVRLKIKNNFVSRNLAKIKKFQESFGMM